MTDPTTPTPPEGLTDEQLLQLMPEQFRADLATASRLAAQDAGPDIKPGVFRVILNTGALDYARAAIAADRAARPTPAPAPTPTELQAQFRAWFQREHCLPPSPAAAAHAAAFVLYLQGQEAPQ